LLDRRHGRLADGEPESDFATNLVDIRDANPSWPIVIDSKISLQRAHDPAQHRMQPRPERDRTDQERGYAWRTITVLQHNCVNSTHFTSVAIHDALVQYISDDIH
jgi:hypothetical protein